MNFEFFSTGKIVFGDGVIKQAGPIGKKYGGKALLITGAKPSRWEIVINDLKTHGISVECLSVPSEPDFQVIRDGSRKARESGCQFVIGIGGGSVIDAGKAVSAMATNDGDVLDYIEVIGRGKPIERAPLPYLAIPTTAGTGAEVTKNAVIFSPEHEIKASLRSPLMFPSVALVDPELTFSLPPDLTATTGLDALTQLIEPFLSKKANPITDGFCREGLKLAPRALFQAFHEGGNRKARNDMSVSSLLSGMALAHSGLGAAHGFAAAIGGEFRAPHGAICARVLPGVMKINLAAIRKVEPRNPVLSKFEEVACFLTGNPKAAPDDSIPWLENACTQLKIPTLRAYRISQYFFRDLIQKARNSSSMQGNPISLTDGELEEILEKAC